MDRNFNDLQGLNPASLIRMREDLVFDCAPVRPVFGCAPRSFQPEAWMFISQDQ